MDVSRAMKWRGRGIITDAEFIDAVWKCLREAPDQRDVYSALLDALAGDESSELRGGIAAMLGSIKAPWVVEPLCRALEDVDADVRWRVAGALGQCKDARALEPLCLAMEDEAPVVRWSAASALGEIGDARATEFVCLAMKDHEPLVRQWAAEALGKLKDPAAMEPLCQALGDLDWHVRQRAATALGELAGERAVEPLAKALEDDESDVRQAATEGLGKLGAAAIEPLCKVLDEGTGAMRLAAAEALGRMGDVRAVDSLCRALAYTSADERWRPMDALVHWAAVEALGTIGAAAIEPLCLFLEATNPTTRRMASWAFVDIGPRAVGPLCGVIADTAFEDRAREEAALALGKLQDHRAVGPLCRLLEDDNVGVRSATAHALSELNDIRARGPLLKALEDTDIRYKGPLFDEMLLAQGSWVATPWDYSSCRHMTLSKDGTGELVYGYGQTIYATVKCRWDLPAAGRLRLTYREGIRPGEGNPVAELGYRLIEGEVAGIENLLGSPYKYLWTLELSAGPWPPMLRFPYGVPRVFYGHRQ